MAANKALTPFVPKPSQMIPNPQPKYYELLKLAQAYGKLYQNKLTPLAEEPTQDREWEQWQTVRASERGRIGAVFCDASLLRKVRETIG